MLVLVSAILNECSGENEAVAVAMALEGLRYLCEAEVCNRITECLLDNRLLTKVI